MFITLVQNLGTGHFLAQELLRYATWELEKVVGPEPDHEQTRRLLEFLPDGETIIVRMYSPVLDRYNTDPDQQFTINLNQLPPPPSMLFHAVFANLVVVGTTDPRCQYGGCLANPANGHSSRQHRVDQRKRPTSVSPS